MLGIDRKQAIVSHFYTFLLATMLIRKNYRIDKFLFRFIPSVAEKREEKCPTI